MTMPEIELEIVIIHRRNCKNGVR